MAGVKKSSSSSWAQSAPCSIWRQWNFSQSYFTKRSKVGACFIAPCNWETMKSFCSHRGVEWHENWQNKYAGARPKKDGVILARQLVTFFHPLYLTSSSRAAQRMLWPGAQSIMGWNWSYQLVHCLGSKMCAAQKSWGRLVKRNTNYSSWALFLPSLKWGLNVYYWDSLYY